MTIKAESAGSSIFALDVPLQIAGSFTTLSARPAILSATKTREAPKTPQLPPELDAIAKSNACRKD